jgi:hypothetical protein
MRALLLVLVLALSARIAAARQGAQEEEGTVALDVRVSASERGWARIDRGSSDRLAIGDLVAFFPREGLVQRGTVIELEERAARVELQDPEFVPAPGTRARIELPRERFARGGRRTRGQRAPTPPPPELGQPVFENPDAEWQEGEALLARVRPVRPSERAPRAYGTSYAALDHTRASEDDRHDTFARMGGALVIENPFGRGDRLHADAEWNYRNVDVPDFDDEEDVELRLERLAYTLGGTRFDPTSLQVGRFLQEGLVELGVLDGAEWIARRRNGHRYGASVGFLPEPDEEFQTGSDLQLAGFYQWVADESEQLAFTAGYQKTFHNGATDRDLLVARFQRLPRLGWTVFGTAWIDVYTEGDDVKGTLFGLTQADLAVGRRFEGGSSLDLVFRHLEFPEIEREEFLPVDDDQLDDDHSERLALTSRWQMTNETRLLTRVGVWVDEDEEGGDAELGLDLREVWGGRDFTDVSAFGSRGRFSKSVGARLTFGRFLDNGRWALAYELAQNRLDGFNSNNDDLPQHRLRFSRDHTLGAWDLSWRLEGLVYDDENALQFGLYLQRSHD